MKDDESPVDAPEVSTPIDPAAWERLKTIARLIGRQLAHEEQQPDRRAPPTSSKSSLD